MALANRNRDKRLLQLRPVVWHCSGTLDSTTARTYSGARTEGMHHPRPSGARGRMGRENGRFVSGATQRIGPESMVESSEKPSSELEKVVDDLRAIAAGAVRQKKENGQPVHVAKLEEELDQELALEFDTYVTFLQKASCIELDRNRERMQLLERVTLPLKTPEKWSELVADNFADATGADVSFGEPDADESGQSKDSKGGARVPAPQQVDAGAGASPKSAAEDDEDDEVDEQVGRERRESDGPTPESKKSTEDASAPKSTDENASATEPASPTSGDRYEHVEAIGSGGFGSVHKARDTVLDRVVAIKEVRNIFDVFAQLDPDEVGRRFAKLTRAQAQLSHPAIVEVHDLDTSEQFPFAVTEYAPNGSLRRFVEEGGRELQVAFEYFVQVLHGLKAAHDKGLVHGNIKPENVVLDEHGNAKLSDFGLSNLVALDDTVEQVYIGVSAVEYKAPELLKSRDAETVQSDIYSLGMLFYEMLTGEVPGRRSPMPSDFDADIPEAIDDIFNRMATDSPDERYESVDDVLADFFDADSIVQLLDRRSGVVFLEDPIDGDGKSRGGTDVAGGASGRTRASRSSGAAAASGAERGEGQMMRASGGEGADAAAQTVQESRSWWQKLFG